MTTPDEARQQAHDALTPARRRQFARIADRYRVKHPWTSPITRAAQDDLFAAREAAHEREQERRP